MLKSKLTKKINVKALFSVSLLVFFLLFPLVFTAAQTATMDSIEAKGLSNAFSIAISFFTGWYTKAIAGIALGGLGIGMVMNRGEPGMVKKFIPWIVACIILLSIGPILGLMGFTSSTGAYKGSTF